MDCICNLYTTGIHLRDLFMVGVGWDFQVDVRRRRRDNFIEGGMTALPNAMATRKSVLTTAKALDRALRQAEFDRPATDSAPFFSHAR